jgi:hypothetical protein
MRRDAEDRGSPSFFWTQQLMEMELNDPDRWGHSGYKDLYPEEFITKPPVDQADEEQSDKGRKEKGERKPVKRKKKKKKEHKKKEKVKSAKKKCKAKNRKYMKKSDCSSDDDSDTEDTDSSEHKTKDRHSESTRHGYEINPNEQESEDSETSIDVSGAKRQKISHREFGINDSEEEVRPYESIRYVRTKTDQPKRIRLKITSDWMRVDRHSTEQNEFLNQREKIRSDDS